MAQTPLPKSAQPPASSPNDEIDEISLLDILGFFKRQFKVIGGVTIAAIVASLGMAATQKTQVQRTLSLDVELSPLLGLVIAGDELALAQEIDQELVAEIVSEGTLALQSYFLEHQNDPSALPKVNATTEAVPPTEATQVPEDLRLTLQAESTDGFETFSEAAIAVWETSAADLLEKHIVSAQERLALLIQRSQSKIDFLESQSLSPVAATGDPDTLVNLLQFQQQQAVLAEEFAQLADYEFNQAALARAQSEPEELVEIKILADVESAQGSSLGTRLTLSVIAGLMLGIFIGLLVDQFPKFKAALSQL